ncbi:MAG: secondary thiamine-phosphate synthase enzyme YjbQ [Elusimicrobiota bacterium]
MSLKIITKMIGFSTQGQNDIINMTGLITEGLEKSGLRDGQATVFVIGSTAGVTTIEYEPGLVKDMAEAYGKLAPADKDYAHHETWGCDNGSSHVRAALQGPSLTIPFVKGRLTLGTWQQVVLTEFDTRPRDREIMLQLIGV